MSNEFKLGATYKLQPALMVLMQHAVKAVFKGDDGVFTVHALSDGTDGTQQGSIYTDDITSVLIPSRCNIPAHIIEDCTLVSDVTADNDKP